MATLPAALLVERYGRRILLLVSELLLAVSLVALVSVLMALNMPEYGRSITYGVIILLLLLGGGGYYMGPGVGYYGGGTLDIILALIIIYLFFGRGRSRL